MFANSLIIYNYTIKKLVHNLKDDLKENSFLFENEMLVRKLEKYSDPFISTTVIPRGKLQNRRSKQFVSKIKMRYCGSLQLKYFRRQTRKHKNVDFSIFEFLYELMHFLYKIAKIVKLIHSFYQPYQKVPAARVHSRFRSTRDPRGHPYDIWNNFYQ